MAINITTLANGLRVVSDPMDGVESVSVGVWIGVGTRHEEAAFNGISHLLEHMAFKGTPSRSALDIAEQIEDVGGHINAYTTRETTAYYARVLKDDLELAVDIIGDILQNSTMVDEELARERAVIIQEINQANDTPDDVIFDLFQAIAYPDQPLGRPVLGHPDIVGDMARGTVLDYMKTNYQAPVMVLAAAGAVDHDQFVRLAERHFAGLGDAGGPGRQPGHYSGGNTVEHRKLEQAHVLMGFEGIAYDDQDYYALSVLTTLFGGGMSSRLFQEVREKRGLAYSIYSFTSNYMDTGLFGIYAGTGADETPELLDVIADEIKKLSGGVPEAEIARARAQLKASILMSLESSSSRSEQLARQMLVFDRPIPTDEIVTNIDAVDAVAIARVAERIFASPQSLAMLGPLDKQADRKAI
ncbi:MAG: insulinase family protein [Rhodospirillaceae bacterium]|nr:insulinase family protein [Rhodospirillaceae bacterium]